MASTFEVVGKLQSSGHSTLKITRHCQGIQMSRSRQKLLWAKFDFFHEDRYHLFVRYKDLLEKGKLRETWGRKAKDRELPEVWLLKRKA